MSRPVEVGSQRARLTRRVDGEEARRRGVGRRQVDDDRGRVRRNADAAKRQDVGATGAKLAAVAAGVEDADRALRGVHARRVGLVGELVRRADCAHARASRNGDVYGSANVSRGGRCQPRVGVDKDIRRRGRSKTNNQPRVVEVCSGDRNAGSAGRRAEIGRNARHGGSPTAVRVSITRQGDRSQS